MFQLNLNSLIYKKLSTENNTRLNPLLDIIGQLKNKEGNVSTFRLKRFKLIDLNKNL